MGDSAFDDVEYFSNNIINYYRSSSFEVTLKSLRSVRAE